MLARLCRTLCIVLSFSPYPRVTLAQQPSTLPSVDFVKNKATMTEAITAIALQTHAPIAIILGRDRLSMCSTMYEFDLHETNALRALMNAASQAQYSVSQEGSVIRVTAPDVTARQRLALAHHFSEFKAPQNATPAEISFQLAGWLWSEMDRVGQPAGYGGSILGSMDEPHISLPASMPNVTTEEIADRVITTGPGGLWIAKLNPDEAVGAQDELISFYSYGNPTLFKEEVSCAQY